MKKQRETDLQKSTEQEKRQETQVPDNFSTGQTSRDAIIFFQSEEAQRHRFYQAAHELLFQAMKLKSSVEPVITLNNQVIQLKQIAKGGLKKVYATGNDYVIFLQNMDCGTINSLEWEKVVKTEVAMARKLNSCGLLTQQYEEVFIEVDKNPLIVIKAPSFLSLRDAEVGKRKQVRDSKRSVVKSKLVFDANCQDDGGYKAVFDDNDDEIGSSMIFGTHENLCSYEHWEKVFQHIAKDIVLCLSHGFNLDKIDSFNLALCDTDKTHDYTHACPELFSERHQEIRLFFYDFTRKDGGFSGGQNHDFIDVNGEVVIANVKKAARSLVIKALDLIMTGITNHEYKNISGETELYPFSTLQLPAIALSIKDKIASKMVEEITCQVEQSIAALSEDEKSARFSVAQYDETIQYMI